MDMTDTIAPKSDQANADDFVSGPRTFTITEVRKTGTDDQPVAVYLAEFPADRPFKPSLSMRRIMVAAWGIEASTYVGRRLTLYRDPTVKWGGQAVGGIRISHMSDLKKPLTMALTETRGKRTPFTVQPLPADAPTSPAVSAGVLAELKAMFGRKGVPEAKWLTGTNKITGGRATALAVITEAEARQVMTYLDGRPDAQQLADEHRAKSAAAAHEASGGQYGAPEPTTDQSDIPDEPGDAWPEVATIPGTES